MEAQNAMTLDLPDEIRKNHTTHRRTKSKSAAPHPAPFSSYYPPALDPGGFKKKKNFSITGKVFLLSPRKLRKGILEWIYRSAGP